MPIVQGTILVANVADPQNANRKDRPVVVLTPTHEIVEGVQLSCVAITRQIPTPVTSEFVELPFQSQGRCATRLKARSAAKCDWLVMIPQRDIVMQLGRVPAEKLAQILDYVKSKESP